jgi:dyslexia-associated protein KIAA0319-like protein
LIVFQNRRNATESISEPIKAKVSTEREIVFWPSNDVVLDGTPSIVESDTKIVWSLLSDDYRQQKQSGDVEIVSPHALKSRVSNLRIGQYKFRLTLTTDDQRFVSKSEVLVIVYSQDGRPPKIQIALETPNANVLNNLIILNASGTTADYGITKWQWSKSSNSPAMGHFLNNSNHLPVAYLTNLIEGQYVFYLQVVDDRQQMSEMNVSVHVDGIAEAENLVEILFPSKPELHQQTLENLLSQIRVFLIDVFPNIYIDMIGVTKDNVLLIKGRDVKSNAILPPKSIADHLRAKLKPLRSASNVNILSINTYLCLSNCSNHGKCDQQSKQCACNRYYMANWFKSIVQQEPNCGKRKARELRKRSAV